MKFEYKLLDFPAALSAKVQDHSLDVHLKPLGADGWELVAVVPIENKMRHYLKRAIDVPPNPG